MKSIAGKVEFIDRFVNFILSEKFSYKCVTYLQNMKK